MNKFAQLCPIAIVALMVAALAPSASHAEPAMISGTARVVDGDTMDVGVVRIRLHGIDAPEAGQPCGTADGGTWQCGTASTNRLAELIEGSQVECEALDRDLYGRIISVVPTWRLATSTRSMAMPGRWRHNPSG